MNDLSAVPQSPNRPRVALLVDGDNLSHSHAGALIVKSARHGALTFKRVYGNMAKLPGWDDAPGFKTVHAGTGKNATDILLSVEAMTLMLTRQADILVIASSDGDFSHLAQHLTERGLQVVGLGEAKAPAKFRKSCTQFDEITVKPDPTPAPKPAPPADPLLQQARTAIATDAAGLAITALSAHMHKTHAVQISQTPYKTWRDFLAAHPGQFDIDPKGPHARVRLRA